MKKQFFLSLFMCVALSLHAQTDMTERIVNPGFEEEATGWEISRMGRQGNSDFPLKVGDYYVETWSGAGSRVADGSVEQVLTDLPAGTYTVSVVAQNIQQNDADAKQTGVWLYANDDKTEINLPGKYDVKTTTVDGTLEIGLLVQGATGNYVCVDDFHLTLEEPTEETYEVFREEVGKLITEAESIDKYLDTPEQKVLDAALADGKAVVDGTSTKDVTEVYAALKAAIYNYRLALASPEEPLEMTSNMLNPDFEDDTKGWVSTGFGTQGNDVFVLKSGSYYCEIWNGGAKVPDADIYQFVELPNGNYRLTLSAQNILESNPAIVQSGAYVYANNAKKELNRTAQYTLDFVVVDNQAQIGVNTIGCTGDKVAFDDFHIYYTGFDADVQFAEFKQMIQEGEALLASYQHADSLAALTKAVKEAKAVTEVEDIAGYAAVLRAAINASQTSVGDYAFFLEAIQKSEKVLAEGLANGADGLKAAIDKADGLYKAAKSTREEIELLVKELAQAELLYYAANPSGDVPGVVTSSFIPRGAVGALGRVTVNGMEEKDIKLQGYCWATHKEPTLADNYVTEGEQVLNYPGLIYIMEPLEPATVYYVRAFAMTQGNAVGYGEVRKIITLPMGNCTWSYANNGEPADNERISNACREAMDYYNKWTSIRDYGITVSFGAGTPTAECSYGGWMSVGPNPAYQRTGTVMHESNHGVGVGQHGRWWYEELKASTKWQGLYPTKMPKIQSGVWWQGDLANLIVEFLTNGQDLCNGDGMHMGPFGINGAGADNGTRLLYIANALQTFGLGVDGLPPSGGSPTPYYIFESEDDVKYYITNEDEAYGRGTAYLTENADGTLAYRAVSTDELVGDDAYAWYLVFQPQTCYYLLRNAKSGKYFTFKSGTIKTAEVAEPGENESFHLMRGRVPVILGAGEHSINTKGYWICEGKRRIETPPALQAEADGEIKTASSQDFSNAAANQRWVILTADQLRLVDEGKVALNREKLRRYVAGAKEMMDVPHHDATDDASGSFTALTQKMEAAVDKLTTVEELDGAIREMYTGITSFMTNTVLDNLSAYDLSFLIDNAGMESLDGWECAQADVLLFTNGLCNTSSTFDMYQTLKQMPKGVYRVGVQGFERPGAYSQVGKDYVSGIDNVAAAVYLYNKSSLINNIMAGGQEKKLGTASQVLTQDLYIPNNVAAAVDYMEEHLYDNTLVVEIKKDVEDMKVGLKNTKVVPSDWIVFDNFSLFYYGSNVTEDDVTGINDVEADTVVEGMQGTYDLSGRAISNPTRPGIYIVNGKKVVVH